MSAQYVRTFLCVGPIVKLFVMCEQLSMETPPRTMDLSRLAGISKSYASEIINGKNGCKPSRPLAIHIFRRTSWRHESIADLTLEQIDMLEQIEPFRPASTDKAA